MKIRIVSDEWYPVYFMSCYGDEVEVEDAKVEEWKRVFAEFERVQNEMEAAAKGALTGTRGTGSAAVFSADESVPQGGGPLLRAVRSNGEVPRRCAPGTEPVGLRATPLSPDAQRPGNVLRQPRGLSASAGRNCSPFAFTDSMAARQFSMVPAFMSRRSTYQSFQSPTRRSLT